MIDLTMNLTAAGTILTTVTAVLGFFWGLFHNKKKKSNDDSETEEETLKSKIEKIEKQLSEHDLELQKLSDMASVSKEENSRLKQDFLDNLDRIENRLEKMIELILRIKRDD